MKQMIKRKDGSYSQRGLWDNIRANRGSGKKPTAQMLKQERKIKTKMAEGGINNPGFQALPGYVQAKIRSNMQEGGMTGSPIVDMISNQTPMPIMQMGGSMPQTSAGRSVLQEAMAMSVMQSGGELNRVFNKANRKDAPVVLNPKNKNQFYLNKQMDTDLSYRQHQQMLNQSLGKPYIDELGNEEGNTPIELDSRVEQAYRISNLRNSLKEKNKMQVGAYIPPTMRIGDRGNYSGSDNTMAPNPAVMQQRFAEAQAYKKKISTEQGKIQAQQAHQRAQSNMAANRVKQEQKAAAAKAQQVADMKARIEDSIVVQDMSLSDQFKPENIERATQATGDKLRLFGPSSPLVTSGLFEADPNSFIDNYLNPAKLVGDMATNLGQGINETAKTGDFTAVGKALATPVIAGATMGYLKGPVHSLEKKAVNYLTKNVNSAALGTALANPSISTGVGVGASLLGQGISRTVKTAGQAAEHDLVHRATAPTVLAPHKHGGTIKDMYYMKNGGQFPDRYKKMGFSGVDKPKRTTSGGKSHAVVTKVDGNYKLIRFGQAGEVGSPDGSARNKAFKARHAKNIAKGKSSAAYWANKVKW